MFFVILHNCIGLDVQLLVIHDIILHSQKLFSLYFIKYLPYLKMFQSKSYRY